MSNQPGNDAPETLTIAPRFNGPPDSANGGYISGLLARRLAAPAVRVTLRTPPPLGTAMSVQRSGTDALRLFGATAGHTSGAPDLIAEAAAVPEPEERVEPVWIAEAEHAEQGFLGFGGHPFPTCFVCGTERAPGDGLRLFAGPVQRAGGAADAPVVACTWTPHPSLAEKGADEVPLEMVWAALDCPGGWSSDVSGRPMVLGRMAAAVRGLPRTGRPHVVMGRLIGSEGRKVFTASSLYTGDGVLLATAEATWIALKS